MHLIPPSPRRSNTTLRSDTRGLALIEFAFGLPILLAIALTGLETANMALSILRVHQIAATAADNAARVREAISEYDVNEVLTGGKIVGEKIGFVDRGRIVLSSVKTNGLTGTNAGQTIVWQRCTGKLNVTGSQPAYGLQDKGKTNGALQTMGATGRTITPVAGSVLIFAEVTYRYKPVVSDSILGTPLLRSEAAFTVRERPTETFGTSPTGTASSICTRYDL